MMRVGALSRVSTERKEQDTSIDNQQQLFTKYVKDKGWVITKTYNERKSGTKANRPEIKKLIEDIKANEIDVVLVKDLSRLARNGELSYQIANLAKEKGVYIISLDGMINTMENDMGNLGLFAWIYQKESENLSQKMKSIVQLKATNGKYQGSVPPYGYHAEKGKLFIKQDETPKIVRRIFDEYIKGYGVDSIAKRLTKDGVPTPAQVRGMKNAGMDWGGTSIKGILSNPHYTGHLVQGRTATVSVVSTKRKVNEKDEHIVVENMHEALIPRDIFETAQKLMKERKKDLAAPKKHLFTNVAFCADCGKGMWYRSGKRYICGSYGRYGNERCSSHSINEKELSNAIIQDFRTFLGDLNLVVLMRHFQRNIEKTLQNRTKGLRKVEDKIKLLDKRRINYIQMRADGDMSAEEYKAVIERNNAELAALQGEIDTLSESTTHLEFDLDCTQNDFMNYLFTIDVLPELIHRFISRIDIEADGTARIQYSFKEPTLGKVVC